MQHSRGARLETLLTFHTKGEVVEMIGPINSAVSGVLYVALLDGVYPKQRGDSSVGISCLTVVSTSLVYCNTIRHLDIAVKLHAHFCK